MKTQYTVAIAILVGIGLGVGAVEGLRAQAKPPVYFIAEVDVTNPEAYAKEFDPLIIPTVEPAGGRFVARGHATPIEGEPPKTRVVVQVWDSIEKIRAWQSSAQYKEARKIGDKYAKFRSFVVPGVPQLSLRPPQLAASLFLQCNVALWH